MTAPFPERLDPRALEVLPRDLVGHGAHPPSVVWPGGALVAVSLVVNYEEGAEYSLLDGDAHNDTWGESSAVIPPTVRDLGTEAAFEFGSRVGIWRLARLFDEHAVPVTFAASALALERNPELCAWLRERDHEVMGHGRRWTEDSRTDLAREREALHAAVASVQATTGQRLRGWMTRSFPSVHTRALLLEEGGFLYDSDSTNDELPWFARRGERPFVVVPYTKVTNDVRYHVPPFWGTPDDFLRELVLTLDVLVDEARRGLGGRTMSVGLHPRWSGQAGRSTAVRRFVEHVQATDGAAFLRRVDIARHWIATYA